jgi:hypothetical protein
VALPEAVAVIMDAGVLIIVQQQGLDPIQVQQIPGATAIYAHPVGFYHQAMSCVLMRHLQLVRNRTWQHKNSADLIRMVCRYICVVLVDGSAEFAILRTLGETPVCGAIMPAHTIRVNVPMLRNMMDAALSAACGIYNIF